MKISVEGLSFTYPGGIQALTQIDLEINPGEKVAIVGQNGAGKTTLVRHFNGLLKPTAGKVKIGDWDTQNYSIAQLASRIGYVFQNPDDQLFSSTVGAEIEFGPKNLGYEKEKVVELVQDAIQLTELQGKEDINPYDLSPTWRKMVALASIISMDTPIVILDEPTTGQDAVNIARIAHVVHTLHSRNKTVITITHDIDFCAENFNRVIVMGEGNILLDDIREEIFTQVEILSKTYVEPPQLTRLADRLGFDRAASTPEEFLDLIQQP